MASGGVAGGLSLFAGSVGCGEGECGVSGGEVADSGKFPVRDDKSGVGVFVE